MDMQTKPATIPSPQVRLAEPDLVLLYLASSFVRLHDAHERDEATLDALAELILGERAKTLLGLALRACAEKWLRRYLWMVDFDSLSPSDQAARLVIDRAIRISGFADNGGNRDEEAFSVDPSWWVADLRGTRH